MDNKLTESLFMLLLNGRKESFYVTVSLMIYKYRKRFKDIKLEFLRWHVSTLNPIQGFATKYFFFNNYMFSCLCYKNICTLKMCTFLKIENNSS